MICLGHFAALTTGYSHAMSCKLRKENVNSSRAIIGDSQDVESLATGDSVDLLLADALCCAQSFLVSETSLGDVAERHALTQFSEVFMFLKACCASKSVETVHGMLQCRLLRLDASMNSVNVSIFFVHCLTP